MRRNSRLSCAGVNSAHPVSPLGRRPRGLRLMEEVQQLPLSELSEGCVGTLRSQRRIASEAALALGAGPQLEQQPKFILPDRPSRWSFLPQWWVVPYLNLALRTRKKGGLFARPPSLNRPVGLVTDRSYERPTDRFGSSCLRQSYGRSSSTPRRPQPSVFPQPPSPGSSAPADRRRGYSCPRPLSDPTD